MNKIKTSVFIILTVILIFALDYGFIIQGNALPRLGYLFSPFHGFWSNAESADINKFKIKLDKDNLEAPVDIYFDTKMVPHIYAQNYNDLYYTQGYLHAKFRLWQMDFMTRVGGGRLSEVMGEKTLQIDQLFRRLGFNMAAENNLKELDTEPKKKQLLENYILGINDYIKSLNTSEYPLEFKLLNYKPELWDIKKTLLFHLYISYDLTSGLLNDELGLTNAKEILSEAIYNKWYGYFDFGFPVIPKGTPFAPPSFIPQTPSNQQVLNSTSLNKQAQQNKVQYLNDYLNPNPNNGSNNWAVTRSKSSNKSAILCNDPHLALKLPAIWFEQQLTVNNWKVYGVTFPGIPGILIGFNDSIAWGSTNAYRDVLDTYKINFKDSTQKEYKFNNKWVQSEIITETIHIRGKPSKIEKIAKTNLGLVSFTPNYQNKYSGGHYLALRWTLHTPNSSILDNHNMNNAQNFTEFKKSINDFTIPGQNFVYADRQGNIGLIQQGLFVAKWQGQGDFTSEGQDDNYTWQKMIPSNENPQIYNPEYDYVSSANQIAADPSYPYYLGNSTLFSWTRAIAINKALQNNKNFDIIKMMQLQTNSYNILASEFKNIYLKNMPINELKTHELDYFSLLKNWDCTYKINDIAATISEIWWDNFYKKYNDHFIAQSQNNKKLYDIYDGFLIQQLKNNPDNYGDLPFSTEKETVALLLKLSFQEIIPNLDSLKKVNKLGWFQYNPLEIAHLLGTTAVPSLGKKIYPISGNGYAINSIKPASSHGPSWRMIIEMGPKIKGVAIYPGGQSGNPGSKYYDNFIQTWASNSYFWIIFETAETIGSNKNILTQFHF
ncbi:MAG: penicillin acylase family protein [Alphaproteobacteria bacterium]|nr:penicillin acylase family protein [Alphaproteobacteria bacterium]